jgi:YegS/Rv2252/BmrU family lipid kinase
VDIALVWNGKAGSACQATADDVRAQVAAATGRAADVLECEGDRDPCAATREALAAGAQLIVACGGDGTVSSCATELIAAAQVGGSVRAELGVLPLGTANSFAAALEIPDELNAAIAALALPSRRVVDAAVVESSAGRRTMILHCMVGLHAETVGETSTDAKRRWGVLAYAATALKKLAALEPFAAEMQTRHHVIKCRAIQISAANLAPLKTVLAHGPSHVLGDDGRVDVTIIAADTIAEAIATGVHLYRAGRDHAPATRDNVGSFSAPHIEIRTQPEQAVLVDGEPFGHTPVTIDTLAAALVIVAPAASEAVGDPVEAELVGLPALEVARR